VTTLGVGPLYLPIDIEFQKLIDSVSLICGSRDGYSFCGSRQIIVYELDTSTEYDLSTSNVFAWDSDNK